MKSLRVLLLGDVVGSTGRFLLQKHIKALQEQYSIDATIVNGENSSSNGRGITSKIMRFFKHNNVDVVTSGNHIWQSKDIYDYLNEHTDLLRPANFPAACPGVGFTTFTCKDVTIAVVNVQGRVFMHQQVECPFRTMETILEKLKEVTPIIFVDVHAETTAEKMGLAFEFEGRVSAVVGTHTHVQTADERVLPKGTAYITDLGMAGSLNSMLGMKKEPILHNFKTQMPVRFEVDDAGPGVLSGVFVDVDVATGKALHIERIRVIDNDITVVQSLD